jgi:UDP-glucose 4-epimerase
LGGYLRVPADQRDLNYDRYFETGAPEMEFPEPYTSHNTERLTVPQIKEKLLSLDYVRRELGVKEGRP